MTIDKDDLVSRHHDEDWDTKKDSEARELSHAIDISFINSRQTELEINRLRKNDLAKLREDMTADEIIEELELEEALNKPKTAEEIIEELELEEALNKPKTAEEIIEELELEEALNKPKTAEEILEELGFGDST